MAKNVTLDYDEKFDISERSEESQFHPQRTLISFRACSFALLKTGSELSEGGTNGEFLKKRFFD
ncbi:hypothetical protein FJZ31_18300 [Candidatus Poribacteria bacterium]|nr:hypothetical protein [Candidatus Poribacteria bacterium]